MNVDPITVQPVKSGDELAKSTLVSSYGSTDKNLPKSLQQLAGAQEVVVKQLIDPVEVAVGCCARPCRYSICADGVEEQCLYVEEVSDCYARQIMGAARGFKLKFTDNEMIDVMHVIRPQTCSRGCCAVCCCCSLPSLEIQTPPGTNIATLTERRTCWYPVYDIATADGQHMYMLRTSCCYSGIISIFGDIHIDIIDPNDETVAQIVKYTKKDGYEFLGQRNDFKIKYTGVSTFEEKAAILGSLFLLDFHYFERQNRCCC